MKTTAALVALMAAGAIAQPHNHARHAHAQHHRDLEERGAGKTKTDWVTHWVTTYVTVDGPVPEQTEAASDTLSPSPGKFKDQTTTTTTSSEESSTSTSTTSTPTSEPEPTSEEPEPTTETPPPEEKTKKEEEAKKPATTNTPPPPPPPVQTTEEAQPEPTPTNGGGNGGGSNNGGGGGGGGESHSGFITYYDIGLGACGHTDSVGGSGSIDNPMVVAISKNIFFDGLANPNSMELCDKKILIESPDAPGVKAYGIIRDACQACTTIGDIDVNIEGMRNFYPDAVSVGKGSISWSLL